MARLSFALGIPLSQVHDMTADELAVYIAWENLYGILGPQRSDIQNGNLVAAMVSPYIKKGFGVPSITKLMVPRWEEPEAMTEAELMAQFARLCSIPERIKAEGS